MVVLAVEQSSRKNGTQHFNERISIFFSSIRKNVKGIVETNCRIYYIYLKQKPSNLIIWLNLSALI